MSFTFPVRLFTGRAYFASLEKAVQAVTDGLKATGRNADWRLSWPGDFARYRTFPVAYDVDFDLANSVGKVIGTRRVRLSFGWSISGENPIEVRCPSPGTEQVTITAKVDDITDTLTIRVRAVNGKDPKLANVPISAISERPPSDSDYQFDRLTGELADIGGNVTHIPGSIWGAPVTSTGDQMVEKNRPLSLSISDSITSIGDSAFAMNQLTSVTIPSSVTIIEDGAFVDNQLTSVTIPDSVRIGSKAIRMHSKLMYPKTSDGVDYILRNASEPGTNYELIPVLLSGFSIIIGAGVSLEQDSFYTTETESRSNIKNYYVYKFLGSPEDMFGFTDFYNQNGKKAGTYIYIKSSTFKGIRGVIGTYKDKGYRWFYK